MNESGSLELRVDSYGQVYGADGNGGNKENNSTDLMFPEFPHQ